VYNRLQFRWAFTFLVSCSFGNVFDMFICELFVSFVIINDGWSSILAAMAGTLHLFKALCMFS